MDLTRLLDTAAAIGLAALVSKTGTQPPRLSPGCTHTWAAPFWPGHVFPAHASLDFPDKVLTWILLSDDDYLMPGKYKPGPQSHVQISSSMLESASSELQQSSRVFLGQPFTFYTRGLRPRRGEVQVVGHVAAEPGFRLSCA